jgi:hypothetical protein
MTTIDQCLAKLVPLVQKGGDDALMRAESCIEQLVSAAPIEPGEAVLLLGELQDKLGRQTTASPLRSDLLDALGARIVRLLENESDLNS